MDSEKDVLAEEPLEVIDEDMADEVPPCPSSRTGSPGRRWRMAAAFAAVAAVFLLVGIFLGNRGVRLPFVGDQGNLLDLGGRVEEVVTLLDRDALVEYDSEVATEDSLQALVESNGDQYAVYYTPSQYQQYLLSTSGSYAGIGVVLSDCGKYALVSYVYPDSPADKAGIEPGDAFVSIDGVEREWTAEGIVSALKREIGQTADIVILRPTDESLGRLIDAVESDYESGDGTTAAGVELQGERIELTVEYSDVTVPDSEYELMGDVGYIGLFSFNMDSAKRVSNAIKELESQGARALVLDLRGDGGGYVDQAIKIASLFIPDGAVLQLKERGSNKVQNVTGDVVTDLPLVVLVDDKSASSSEIVTAALKDHGRATIVGTKTYGKGTVQAIQGLSWGGAVKYTLAEYLSPNGTPINGEGIEPDIVVEQSEEYLQGDSDIDLQLDHAIETARSLAAKK